jgi:hypothetical protein
MIHMIQELFGQTVRHRFPLGGSHRASARSFHRRLLILEPVLGADKEFPTDNQKGARVELNEESWRPRPNLMLLGIFRWAPRRPAAVPTPSLLPILRMP